MSPMRHRSQGHEVITISCIPNGSICDLHIFSNASGVSSKIAMSIFSKIQIGVIASGLAHTNVLEALSGSLLIRQLRGVCTI